MKVTFLAPPLSLAGGTRVIAIYAKLLQDLGHQVTVCAPAHRARGFVAGLLGRAAQPQPPSHFDGVDVPLRISAKVARLGDGEVPDGDVVIATWWETAEWAVALAPSKGAKAYFVQHHEVHSYLPVDRVRATYRLPLHKIVIARWLADVMRDEYGDADVDLVPNSVDHDQFFAPPRGKQARPTVGLLYATADWKRFDLAFEAIRRVREHLPELEVRSFGSWREPPFPEFVTHVAAPPQASLRDIYAACDVWLTASSSEGFNLPAMEAMACRTPVVATRTGWPAEAIVDGVNGACVDVDDVEGLARETQRVLRLADADWRAVSQAAFDTVRHSSWLESAKLFAQALERARRKAG